MTQEKYNRFWLPLCVAFFLMFVWAVEAICHAIKSVEYKINDRQ
jgi:hypothetical protein